MTSRRRWSQVACANDAVHADPQLIAPTSLVTTPLPTVLAVNVYADAFTRQVTAWCSRHGLQHAMSAYEEQFFFQVLYGGDMFQNLAFTFG